MRQLWQLHGHMGAGAVLLQASDLGFEKPVSFFSKKKLLPTELFHGRERSARPHLSTQTLVCVSRIHAGLYQPLPDHSADFSKLSAVSKPAINKVVLDVTIILVSLRVWAMWWRTHCPELLTLLLTGTVPGEGEGHGGKVWVQRWMTSSRSLCSVKNIFCVGFFGTYLINGVCILTILHSSICWHTDTTDYIPHTFSMLLLVLGMWINLFNFTPLSVMAPEPGHDTGDWPTNLWLSCRKKSRETAVTVDFGLKCLCLALSLLMCSKLNANIRVHILNSMKVAGLMKTRLFE